MDSKEDKKLADWANRVVQEQQQQIALNTYLSNRKDKFAEFILNDPLLTPKEKNQLITELNSDSGIEKEEAFSETSSFPDSFSEVDSTREPTPFKSSAPERKDRSPRISPITSLPDLATITGRARTQSQSPRRNPMSIFSPRRISPRPEPKSESPPLTSRSTSSLHEESKSRHKSSPKILSKLMGRRHSAKDEFLSLNAWENRNVIRMPIDSETAERYLKESKRISGTNLKFYEAPEKIHEIIIPSEDVHQGYLLDRETCFGQGGLAKVVAAFVLETGELCSAKVFNRKVYKPTIDKEVNNLIRLNRYYGSFDLASKEPIIFMKYFPGNSLLDFLYEIDHLVPRDDPSYCNKKKIIPPFQKLRVICLLLEALSEFHDAGLLHRDLKPENFLIHIDDEGFIHITLIDVGDAVDMDENRTEHCGTDGYIPPELFGSRAERKPYTKECDFYQIGIVISEVISQENYQRKFREKLIEFTDEDLKQDLTPELITAMLHDVFGKKTSDEFEICDDDIEKYVNDIIYNHIIFHALNALVLSLFKSRLNKSSLHEEIKKLQELEQSCLALSKMITALFIEASKAQANLLSTVELLFANKYSTEIREHLIQPQIYNGVLNDIIKLFKALLINSPEEEKAPLIVSII